MNIESIDLHTAELAQQPAEREPSRLKRKFVAGVVIVSSLVQPASEIETKPLSPGFVAFMEDAYDEPDAAYYDELESHNEEFQSLLDTFGRSSPRGVEEQNVCSNTEQAQATTEDVAKEAPEVFSNTLLPEENRQEICDIVEALLPYNPVQATVRIRYNENKYKRGNYYSDTENLVVVSAPFEKDVEGADLSTSVLFHEIAHDVFQDALDIGSQGAEEVDVALGSLKGNMRYKMPTKGHIIGGYDITSDEPLWAVLAESTYVEQLTGVEYEAGHPWDSSHELFASTLNVMRTFPDYFLESFESALSTNEQQAVKQAVEATLNTLLELNGEISNLEKVIPKVNQLTEQLGLNLLTS